VIFRSYVITATAIRKEEQLYRFIATLVQEEIVGYSFTFT